jgi:hypothetical protein
VAVAAGAATGGGVATGALDGGAEVGGTFLRPPRTFAPEGAARAGAVPEPAA